MLDRLGHPACTAISAEGRAHGGLLRHLGDAKSVSSEYEVLDVLGTNQAGEARAYGSLALQ